MGVVSISVIVFCFEEFVGYNTELTGGLKGGSRFPFAPEVGSSKSKIFVWTTFPGGRPFLCSSIGLTTVVLDRLQSTRLVKLSESAERALFFFFQQQKAMITMAMRTRIARIQPMMM